MKERTKILEGLEAFNFYVEATEQQTKFTFEDDKFKGIGGWWGEWDDEGNPMYISYDFTSGNEVFIEEFSDKDEAIKYASGIIAVTKDGTEI